MYDDCFRLFLILLLLFVAGAAATATAVVVVGGGYVFKHQEEFIFRARLLHAIIIAHYTLGLVKVFLSKKRITIIILLLCVRLSFRHIFIFVVVCAIFLARLLFLLLFSIISIYARYFSSSPFCVMIIWNSFKFHSSYQLSFRSLFVVVLFILESSKITFRLQIDIVN